MTLAGTSSHLFDEARFPIAWRFNAADCGLSTDDKQRVVLFEQAASQMLWERFIPVPSLIAGLPRDIFIKGWDDFFYPSDENTVLVMPGRAEVIISFEENLFYGQCVRPMVATL
ncbi:hypothetical protein CW358_10480 [Pseudomonas protegens]|nr:hypothetical protein CW358_10480 [Pseudomonas protegens]